MTTQPEARVVKKIRTYLQADGWLTWKNHGSAYAPPGLPDVMGVRNGRLIAIECKTPRGTPTKSQESWIRRLRNQGAIAGIARSVADVKELIDGKAT